MRRMLNIFLLLLLIQSDTIFGVPFDILKAKLPDVYYASYTDSGDGLEEWYGKTYAEAKVYHPFLNKTTYCNLNSKLVLEILNGKCRKEPTQKQSLLIDAFNLPEGTEKFAAGIEKGLLCVTSVDLLDWKACYRKELVDGKYVPVSFVGKDSNKQKRDITIKDYETGPTESTLSHLKGFDEPLQCTGLNYQNLNMPNKGSYEIFYSYKPFEHASRQIERSFKVYNGESVFVSYDVLNSRYWIGDVKAGVQYNYDDGRKECLKSPTNQKDLAFTHKTTLDYMEFRVKDILALNQEFVEIGKGPFDLKTPTKIYRKLISKKIDELFWSYRTFENCVIIIYVAEGQGQFENHPAHMIIKNENSVEEHTFRYSAVEPLKEFTIPESLNNIDFKTCYEPRDKTFIKMAIEKKEDPKEYELSIIHRGLMELMNAGLANVSPFRMSDLSYRITGDFIEIQFNLLERTYLLFMYKINDGYCFKQNQWDNEVIATSMNECAKKCYESDCKAWNFDTKTSCKLSKKSYKTEELRKETAKEFCVFGSIVIGDIGTQASSDDVLRTLKKADNLLLKINGNKATHKIFWVNRETYVNRFDSVRLFNHLFTPTDKVFEHSSYETETPDIYKCAELASRYQADGLMHNAVTLSCKLGMKESVNSTKDVHSDYFIYERNIEGLFAKREEKPITWESIKGLPGLKDIQTDSLKICMQNCVDTFNTTCQSVYYQQSKNRCIQSSQHTWPKPKAVLDAEDTFDGFRILPDVWFSELNLINQINNDDLNKLDQTSVDNAASDCLNNEPNCGGYLMCLDVDVISVVTSAYLLPSDTTEFLVGNRTGTVSCRYYEKRILRDTWISSSYKKESIKYIGLSKNGIVGICLGMVGIGVLLMMLALFIQRKKSG